MLKKRLMAMVLAGVMAVSMTACGSSSTDSTASSSGSSGSASSGDDEIKVSVILKTLSAEYWQFVKAGCDQYAADNPNVTVDVKGPPSETSYDEQQNMIETDIASSDYDAYCISPLQSDLVATLISGESRPVIALDTKIEADEIVSFVGTGNVAAAKAGAEAAVEAAKEAGWETIECIEIAGVQGDTTCSERMQGYQEGVEENGGDFLEDEVQYADAVADKAVNCMEAIMQTHPEGVAIICAHNDDMAMAAARTAKESGNENYANTIFLGFNGDIAGCESILDDQMTMSIAQQAYEMGYKAVETAVAAVQGEEVEEFVDSGTEIVTKDNAQERIDTLNGYLGNE